MNAVDTNVLVYSVSSDEPVKGPKAMALLDRLDSTNTILLWQVACEFGAVLAKLHRMGRAPVEVFDALQACRGRFPLVLPEPQVLDLGLRLHRQHGLSYWDAMLLAACSCAGVTAFYSEDIQAVPEVAGVRILNPFAN